MTGKARSVSAPARRLPSAERRRQLLDVALKIVREEGADRLTLGHLAVRAGVSKPVAYDHFRTRSGLLTELYRWIDRVQMQALYRAVAASGPTLNQAAEALAVAYIHCGADTSGEFHAVGAALAGSEEKAKVYQELLDNCIQMFVMVLKPYAACPLAELERCCVGLVGAGEALSAALLRGQCSEAQAAVAFRAIIQGALQTPPA